MTKQAPDIQSIHPLTPLQQGMLFHTLLATEPVVYVVQTVLTLVGDVHASTLQRAWQRVLDRHEVLRSLFVWRRQERPLQVVRPQVVLPWEQLDWVGMPDSDQQAQLDSCLRADRKRGFDLSKAPLMRMTLIQMEENRYELIWTTHHLLLDGWSTFLVIKDAMDIYGALREGRAPQLQHCRPYRDYISWLQRQDLSKAETFWRAGLEGFTTPTPLSIDDRPAASAAGRGDEIAIEEQHWPSGAARAFGARHNLTTSTLVHGAWALLLSRYSGEARVLFGSVVSGRPAQLAGVESMVGLFINTLPVLAPVPPEATVVSWLWALQNHLLGLQQFEHSSLVDVQGWSEVPRDQPLFESILAFENYRVDASLRHQNADVSIANVRGIEQTNYPLAVTVVPGDELVVKVAYSRNRFDAATVTRLVGHFRTLLEAIVSNPHRQVADLSMLTEGERRQLLVEGNPPAVAYPGRCLHELIEEQVRRTPDHVAVVFEQETVTYAELDRRATRLARHLRGLGVGPEVRVGLCVERSLEMVVGLLGILKAGGAYVPMDAANPQERIAFMLSDANVSVLLTQTRLLARLPNGTAHVVCLDAVGWSNDDVAPGLEPPGDSSTLAYVIYTSGSTGRPKGVCIEHRNIVNYVLGVADRLQLTPGMQHAMVSTIAADLGNTVLFPALVTGGCLHIISQERAENQVRLAEYFQQHQIDVLKIVPSHLAALQTGSHPERVMPRRCLILGGEASRLEWIERLRGWAPTCKIYNHYGPTETTVGVLTYPVDSQVPRTRTGTLPLGRPLPNSRVYILDPRGQPVPIGVQGELCIGGRGVARGYLNRPELTAEKFVPDPFSPEPGGRLYRTGDRARILPDGSIEFCGRIDHQVKIHGYRIELGEVEAALREQRGLRDAVVVARDAEAGTKQLVAYVVPKRAQPAAAGLAVHALPDGSTVAHLNTNETAYIYNEIFVLQAYLRHGITIRDGDCIVDAGANIGLFTVFASRLAHNLRIMAFEPNPAAFACLQANAEAWGTDVRCFPLGLSHGNTSAELTFFEGFSLLSGFYAEAATERELVKTYALNQAGAPADRGRVAARIDELLEDRFQARTETAQLRTLSSIIAEERLERIDLLKINVEKSELDVLHGLQDSDWPRIRQLVIEVDQQAHVEPITTLLEQRGYEVLVEQDPLLRNTQLCYVYAIRPSAGRRLVRHQPADAHLRSLAPADDEVVTPATLRTCLKARLPQYMIPAAFVLMDAFPLTANGKIDRKALPAPDARPVAPAKEFVAPRDPLEQALAHIWSRILKAKRVGVHDHFFELGGHSLAAIRLLSEVQELTGKTLPLATLFGAPTVATLADILRRDGWAPSWSSLVPIRTDGSKRPLFLVHAAHGNVLLYRQMAGYLADRPVYGLQSEGLNGDGRVDATVQAMASRYVKEIVTVQPHGPYCLGGYCLGGVIALEMAQQLTASGETVDAVVLLDTYNVAGVSRSKLLLCSPVHWLQNLWFHGANTVSLRGRDRGKFLGEKVDIALTRLGIRLHAVRQALRLRGPQTHRRDAHLAVKKINDQAASRYVPRPYGGRVILIRSKGYFWRFTSPSSGWRDVLHDDLIVHELPVYPKGMLIEPYCRVLADAIEMCLHHRGSLAA